MLSRDTWLNENPCGEADFIAQAVAAYRQVKAWREAHPDADLEAIEKQVCQIRRPLTGALIKGLLDISETRPDCPECGKPMSFQGDRGIDVRSLEGDFRLERGYYYCRSCKEGLSPLDEALGL